MNRPSASAQFHYQVRLDWGLAGAQRIRGDADLCVWVDALVDEPNPRSEGYDLVADDVLAEVGSPKVVVANLRNRTAVAQWILAEQVRRGERTSVAVIAVGTKDGGFVVEDFLAAGALIDALATVGIDFCSPEAASAAASFVGLKGAVGHLITASVRGRELIERGQRELVVAAGKIDTSHEVNAA